MENNYHIVEYERYCPTCEYKDKPETNDKCQFCLSTPARVNSRKPVCYKDKATHKWDKK